DEPGGALRRVTRWELSGSLLVKRLTLTFAHLSPRLHEERLWRARESNYTAERDSYQLVLGSLDIPSNLSCTFDDVFADPKPKIRKNRNRGGVKGSMDIERNPRMSPFPVKLRA